MIALIALPLSPLLELFERYVFGDWEFVKWLIVLVCVDTVLGFVKHWLSKDSFFCIILFFLVFDIGKLRMS